MTGTDVRYAGDGVLRLGDGQEVSADGAYTILPRSRVEPLSLAALRGAARKMWDRDLRLLDLWVANVPEQGFDPDKVPSKDLSDVRLVAWEGLDVVFATGHLAEEGKEAWAWVPEVLSPLLERNGARLKSVDVDPADPLDEVIVATIEPQWRGRVGKDALRLGEEASALIEAMRGGPLNLAASADLVRTGYASVLIDQAEGPWLDGKAAPYRLHDENQKLEFAKDVASFANASCGGLIVIGARTKSTPDGDVIRAVRDIDLSTVSVPQMSAIIRARVFPAIEDLDIRRVDHGEQKGVVMIHIPPQPASRTPFLVRGTNVGGAVRTTYFGVPERENEDVSWSDIQTLHGLLQAGKVANAIVDTAEKDASGSGPPSGEKAAVET